MSGQLLERVPMTKVMVVPGDWFIPDETDFDFDRSGVLEFPPNVFRLEKQFTIQSPPLANSDVSITVTNHLPQLVDGVTAFSLVANPGLFDFTTIIDNRNGGLACFSDDAEPVSLSGTNTKSITQAQWNSEFANTFVPLTLVFVPDSVGGLCSDPMTFSVNISYRTNVGGEPTFTPKPGECHTFVRSIDRHWDGNGEFVYIWGQRMYDPVTGTFVTRTISNPLERVTYSGRGHNEEGHTESVTLIEHRPNLVRFNGIGRGIPV